MSFERILQKKSNKYLFGILLNLITLYSFSQPNPGVWMDFNENNGSMASDKSGNGNHGALFNPQWQIVTPDGSVSAVKYPTTLNWVDIPFSNSINLTGNKLTMMASVKLDSYNNNRDRIILADHYLGGGTQFDGGYQLGIDSNGHAYAKIITVNGYFTATVTDPLCRVPEGLWTHIAAVYDGSHLSVFLNGSQTASVSATGNLFPLTQRSLRLGSIGGLTNPDYGLIGAIDEFKLYNAALTETQIRAQASTAMSRIKRLIFFDFPDLGDFDGDYSTVRVKFDFFVPFATTPFFSTSATLDSAGSAFFEVPAVPGVFDALAKPSHWLSDLAFEVPSICNFTAIVYNEMTNGDANNDNKVDDFDLAAVIFDFGSPPSGNNGETDLNGNGQTDDFDLASVIFNFGKRGVVP